MSDFQGIQGGGNESAYDGQYTWGGNSKKRVIVDNTIHQNEFHGGPGGMSLEAASKLGYYQARDDYDGQWLWVLAGQMVPLTAELRAEKNDEPVATRSDLRSLRSLAQDLVADIDRLIK